MSRSIAFGPADTHLCAACACCCDDLSLTVRDGERHFSDNACATARAYLADKPEEEPQALIDNRPASLDAAVTRAAELLSQSRLPLVYGCVDSTVETQTLAVKLTQRLGGVFDSPALAPPPLFPGIGTITCSLGEARNRADLIVVWNCNPEVSHPRLLSHYLLEPTGRFRPSGRRDRTLIVVASAHLKEALPADEFIEPGADRDFAALWSLRTDLHRPTHSGLPDHWRPLADRLRSTRFGVMVMDSSAGPRVIEAAHALATEMQKKTRFYVLTLPGSGNSIGIRQVVSWLTGQGAPACFSGRDSPVFGDEFRAAHLIERQACDAVLTVEAGAKEFQFRSIPQIHLSARISDSAQSPAVAIRTAAFPMSDSGTVFRLDGIAMPLRVTIPSSLPSQFEVLNLIARKLRPAAE